MFNTLLYWIRFHRSVTVNRRGVNAHATNHAWKQELVLPSFYPVSCVIDKAYSESG
jgi:hypothetical protein